MARLLAVAALLGATLLATAGDWPTYLHDPERTASSWDEALLSPANARHLTRLWAFQTGGVIAASPVVAAGTVYVGSWDGYEYALNAATGALKWKTYLGKTRPSPTFCHAGPLGITSSAAVQGGVVYVGGGDSYWYALDAATGAVLWRVYTGETNFNWGHYNWSSPLLYNGFAYIGVASFGDCPLVQGQLLQVDLATHHIVHTFDVVPNGQIGGGIWTSPSVDAATGTIYVTTGTAQQGSIRAQPRAVAIVALDAATLAVTGSWQSPVEQTGAILDQDWGSTPLVYNGPTGTPLVAAMNKDGFAYAFNRAHVGAGPVWRQRIAIGGWCPQCGDGSVSAGAYGHGLLYVAGGAATIITPRHGMLFADTFTAGRLGSPPPSSWRARGSAWLLGRDGIRVVRPVSGDPHVEKELSIDRPRWTDYSVSVDVKAPATWYSFGITGRRRDAQNCYQFVLKLMRRWEFGRRVRGVFHTLAAGAFTYHAGRWYTFSLTFSGTRTWAAINGVTLAALEDGTFRSGGISLRTVTTPEYGRVRVAIASRGSVRALNPSTGAFVWQVVAPDSIIPALAYANGLVIDGAGATLEVRRAASGARLFGYTLGGPIYGAPSVANGRIYTGSMDGKVYAFGVAQHPRTVPRGARGGGPPSSADASSTISEPSTGLTVRVDPRGSYTIAARSPAWTFGGTLGRPLTHMAVATGTDGIGRYREVAFHYHVDAARSGSIRLYHGKPVVLFSVTYLAQARNTAPFPALTTYPNTPYHMSFGGPFGIYRFDLGGADSPWLLFDARANAFILSPASDFMVAATSSLKAGADLARPSGRVAIASGINPGITGLSRGLTHRTMLVVGKGINATFDTWGHAMTDLQGKTRPANDADVGLRDLGYWTDHGAAYYYHYDAARGYAGTLLAVRDEFRSMGLPLGYMQLDSWWYPKGPLADWRDGGGGEYTYAAAPALFPGGLRAFQRRLGLPLITHARWIDAHSPYRGRYAMSNNVSIDPRFWATIAGYLKNSSVTTYEQDWLVRPATAANTIAAQDAFMDNMARATSRNGLSMQYCLPQPRHYLQSTRYDNLYTMRVSNDRFEPSRWTQFLYGSRLAGALGVWPWTDVFMSAERDNLLLATLSAGMVGVGDPLGAVDKANLLQAVRTDGVIVKPDAPIVPIDAVYLGDARGLGGGRKAEGGSGALPPSDSRLPSSARPMVAWTYSDHGAMKAAYVFAYSRGTDTTATFVPASLGLSGRVYVYNYFTGRGALLTARQTFYATVHGGSYDVVVPVGRSGIAFLGDAGKFVSLGKQRIARLSDDGAVHATLAFAAGERAVTLHGYAPSRPTVTATKGAAGPVTYDAASGQFRVAVSPAPDGTAAIRMASVHVHLAER